MKLFDLRAMALCMLLDTEYKTHVRHYRSLEYWYSYKDQHRN